jgi:hypothetical protein
LGKGLKLANLKPAIDSALTDVDREMPAHSGIGTDDVGRPTFGVHHCWPCADDLRTGVRKDIPSNG